ncbi:WD repeat protein-like protein [Aaosphaeria arxii CBS 175.79]|uniref:WD repeat protein-like protein n=1 Tax=Aaosphaeria arxii CBS 175.79 TaxID=1450172 RepID=A0A6A5XVS2_9PLEO|nr:WD repeat protein-like protein [Aaosphaeria arxii CBS 175.79]KAF2017418.1 WD repeat protein-like protein [Aaosphaeria arxii CBS 175.79]
MSLTPSNARMMSPAWAGSIKLTPANSPLAKNTPLRSPIKTSRGPEATLTLKQVIGTTACSANAFDSLPAANSFAFTAGAAAVVATVDSERNVTQRFYRARPTTNPLNPSASVYGGPSTPTQNESRNRTAASLRDAGIGASPLASPATEWADSPSNRTWTAKERIKAATCVSFSPDGKYLAVGETGYKPRVLIFSTAADAPSDTPLTTISDHTFGVRCVAFSPDSQYLASLGSANDGFLYVWSINPRNGAATLHSSNKCTSAINRIAWMDNTLITVGTRHVKVWRIEEPNVMTRTIKRQSDFSFLSPSLHRTLPGRNCILESLLEANFTSVVAVAPGKAIVASEKGDICLIDDSDRTQRFSKVADAGFAVTSMTVDLKGRLHLASSQGGLKTINIKDTIGASTPPPSPPPRVESPTVNLTSGVIQIEAIAASYDYLITVDSQRSILVSHLCATDDETIVGDVVQKLPAHGDPVLGVATIAAPTANEASFYTWSAGGSVLFWNQDGVSKDALQVPLEQIDTSDADTNELKTVRASLSADFLVSGDKYGVLRILDVASKESRFQFKAHANEITDIAIFEANELAYIASASRDRCVQIFIKSKDTWDLMQTLDEHVGAVTGLVFSRNGTRLVSCSSDRTLVVRELVSREDEAGRISAFVILKTIILKTTPVSMAWDVEQDDALLVSTIDRQVHKYDLRNSQTITSFRASDTEGGDAVILGSLAHIPRAYSSPLIAGVSSTDKSIRLYEENGTLAARDWGHTEGVTDIALIKTRDTEGDELTPKSLVTVAVDGTIFVWSLSFKVPQRQDLSKSMDLLTPRTPTNSDLLANRPPLRRVFSQSELARFQRSPTEEDAPTPTGNRSPKLRKRLSKYSLANTPKLDPSPMPSLSRDLRGSVSSSTQATIRRSHRNRSPSPPSPRHAPQITKRRSSVDVRLRAAKAPVSEFGSLGASSESLCRTLRAYRKRLANSSDSLSSEHVRDIERELAQTARAVGEKAKSKGIDETVIVKLLDQYSERLVNILDEKIAASVALRVRENSESGASGGIASPALGKDVEGTEQDISRGIEGLAIDDAIATPITTVIPQFPGEEITEGPRQDG